MSTLTVSQDLRIMSCPSCGIVFGLPQWWYEKRRDLNERWFCPAGHPIVHGCSEAERLRRELDQKERELWLVRVDLNVARRTVKRETKKRRLVEKKLSSQTERVAHGVCPCCNRSFQNLARHMKSKHPELASQKQERILP